MLNQKSLFFLSLLLLFSCKSYAQYFQKEFVADKVISYSSFKQIHQFPDSSILIYGYDHQNRSNIYLFKIDGCRNYKIAFRYDLKNYYSNYIETNQTIILENNLISFPSKGNSSIFSPLLKFDSNGKLVSSRKIYFNDYLIESYSESGICKMSDNKFAIYLPNYKSNSDTSFGLILILDNNFMLLNAAKIYNKFNIRNQTFGFGIYYLNGKITLVHNRQFYSTIDTNLSQIKSYRFDAPPIYMGGEVASQVNDSLLFYGGSTLYDYKNNKILMSIKEQFVPGGSYERRNVSNYIFGGGYGAGGNIGTIVCIEPRSFINKNIEGKIVGKSFWKISDFELVNNNKDVLSISIGGNKKGEYPILTKSKLDNPFFCSSQPAAINFPKQAPIDALPDSSFVLSRNNINIRMEDYMPEITETIIKFRLQTICTTEEPFSGIGINIGKDSVVVCNDTNYTISTMNPGQSSQFYWNTGATTNTITVNKTGVYKLRTVKGQCESIDSLKVVFANIRKLKLPKDTVLCIGSKLLVDATAKQNFITNYKWNDNITIGKRNINVKGNYILAMNNSYGCKDTLKFSVHYRDSLKATIMPDTLICKGAIAKLYAKVQGGKTDSYNIQWYDDKNNWLGIGETLFRTFAISTKVKLLITDSCTNYTITKFVNINVRPPLKISYLKDTSICLGQSVVLFTDGSGGDSLAYSFAWNNNLGQGKNKVVSPLKTNYYRVILKDNCTSKSDTASCTVSIPPVKSISKALPEITDIENPIIVFKNLSTPSIINSWDFGNGQILKTDSRQDIEMEYKDTGNFFVTLKITSKEGCLDDTIIRIRIKDIFKFYVPNAFTPNGDGLNDELLISTRGVKQFKLIIYDRWGGVLFESDNPENNWNGKDAPVGVYAYTVEVFDQDYFRHFHKGVFHLIR